MPKTRPDYYEKCIFNKSWNYYFTKELNEQTGKEEVQETSVLEESFFHETFNPMEAVDIIFIAATTDKHHTFVGFVEHNTGFFMN